MAEITMEKVLTGLMFIAENREMSTEELSVALEMMGCDFSWGDFERQFPNPGLQFEGLKRGDLAAGASVILNMRDGGYGRAFGDDMFLGVDSDTSIYNFVRVVTGDDTYTKKNVERRRRKTKAAMANSRYN